MVAFAVVMLAVFLAVMPGSAAAGQFTSRSITMSDSGASGGAITSGVGSGTNVTYTVSMVVPAASQSLIIDFCADQAIIGSTCSNNNTTYPGISAFSAASATVSNVTGVMGGWTLTKSQYQIKLVGGTATTAATTQTFAINGITNPSANLAFYARMYTWSGATQPGYTNAASVGTNYNNYGAVALQTANVITITAKVQEQLTFCMSGGSISSNCGGTTAPALTLGHGTNTTLDATAVDTGLVYSQVSTNATNGVTVRIKSNTSNGGLAGAGTDTIPPVGSGSATASAITAGTAAFGLKIDAGSGTGTVTVASTYSHATNYGMDTTTSTNNVIAGFGSTVLSSSAPLNNYNNTWTFGATASNVTPAGIYSANIAAIATGTF